MGQGIMNSTEGWDSDFAAVPTSECLTPPQDTTPPEPPTEAPTERTTWSGARPGIWRSSGLVDQQRLQKARPCKTTERRRVQEVTGADLAEGSGEDISPHLLLTVLNVRQQVSEERPDPWRLLWVPGGIQSEHRDASADLLQGQEGVLEQFGSDAVGGEGGHRV